jgi:hypothetical protein
MLDLPTVAAQWVDHNWATGAGSCRAAGSIYDIGHWSREVAKPMDSWQAQQVRRSLLWYERCKKQAIHDTLTVILPISMVLLPNWLCCLRQWHMCEVDKWDPPLEDMHNRSSITSNTSTTVAAAVERVLQLE